VSPSSWFDTHGTSAITSVFAELDTNHDGSLSEAEFKSGDNLTRMVYAHDELSHQWGLCTHGYSLKTTLHDELKDVSGMTSSPFWFAHNAKIPGTPTLKSEFITYKDKPRLKNPWMAPGSTSLDGLGRSPCGWLRQADGSSYTSVGDARKIAPFPDTKTTVWAKGTEVEVKWAISANHGGGYAYRLCKKPDDGDMTKLTEECFQQGHLDFVGDESWVEYRTGDRIPIQAKRTNEGTSPAGKTWTMNPIPSWKCSAGSPHSGGFGGISGDPNDCKEFNFHPPKPNLAGYGYSANGEEASFKWAIVDKVQIPANLNGDYVLSWRWDSEQTPQVWAHCADVKIVDSTTVTTTQKPVVPPDEGDEDDHMLLEWEAHENSVCRLSENDKTTNGQGTIGHRGHVLESFSLETCKFVCTQEKDCRGVEFRQEGNHCEVWSENIGYVKPGKTSWSCHILTRKKSSRLLLVSKAESKGQPTTAAVPRATWPIMRIAIVSGTVTAAISAVAAVAVRRMVRSVTLHRELWSDAEAEQALVA